MSDELMKYGEKSSLPRIASATFVLVAIVVIGCSAEKHERESRAAMHVTGFCSDIAVELESWTRQYKHLNEMPAGPERDEYESHLWLRPSIYVRGAAARQLQHELHLCVSVRKLDPHEQGVHEDEVYLAAAARLRRLVFYGVTRAVVSTGFGGS